MQITKIIKWGIGWAVQIDALFDILDQQQIKYHKSEQGLLTPLWQLWQREPLLISLLIGVIILSSILLLQRPRKQLVEALTRQIKTPKKSLQAVEGWQLIIEDQMIINLLAHQLQSETGLVIGRSQNVCNQIINKSGLSKRHCRLQWAEDQLWLEDLNSSNGTLLNGKVLKPYQSVRVQTGDQITLADISIGIKQ